MRMAVGTGSHPGGIRAQGLLGLHRRIVVAKECMEQRGTSVESAVVDPHHQTITAKP